MAKRVRGRASLYKWYAKAVALKRDDPDLFRELAEIARPGIEEHGVDEESGVASYLREFDRDGIDPRRAVEVLRDESTSKEADVAEPTYEARAARYTRTNIEDWDFREYRNIMDDERWMVPGITAMDAFLSENFTYVMAVENMRLHLLHSLVKRSDNAAELSDDGYVYLTEWGRGHPPAHNVVA